MIDAAARYGVEVLKALGVKAEFVIGSEHTLPNHDLFFKIVRNSIGLQLSDVKSVLPPAGKKEVVTASKMIAPCIQATELVEFGADLVLTPAPLVVQMSLLGKIQPENPPVVIPLPHFMKLKGAKANPVRPDPKNSIFFEDDEVKAYATSPARTTEDYYRHVIADKFVYEKRQIVALLRQHGITALLTSPSRLTVDVVNKYIELKRRGI